MIEWMNKMESIIIILEKNERKWRRWRRDLKYKIKVKWNMIIPNKKKRKRERKRKNERDLLSNITTTKNISLTLSKAFCF